MTQRPAPAATADEGRNHTVHLSHAVAARLFALLPISAAPSPSPSKGASTSGSGYTSLIFLVVIAVVAYFLLIRPQRNRAKQAQQMRSDVVPGVEVLTRHGQHATVTAVNEDGTVTLEIAPGVQSRFVKDAIARVLTPEEPEPDVSGEAPDIETIPDPDEPASDTDRKPGSES